MAPRQPNEKKQKPNTTEERVNNNRRNVTFSKRKAGLFNKLTELSILCNVETSLFIVSPNNKLYACGYPSADAAIDQSVNRSQPSWRGMNERTETLRAEYEALQKELKDDKRRLGEEQKGSRNAWWWETPPDDMDLDSVEQFKKSVEDLMLHAMMQQGSNDNMVPPHPQQVSNHNNALPLDHPHLQPLAVVPPHPQQVNNHNNDLPPDHPDLQPLAVVLPHPQQGSNHNNALPPDHPHLQPLAVVPPHLQQVNNHNNALAPDHPHLQPLAVVPPHSQQVSNHNNALQPLAVVPPHLQQVNNHNNALPPDHPHLQPLAVVAPEPNFRAVSSESDNAYLPHPQEVSNHNALPPHHPHLQPLAAVPAGWQVQSGSRMESLSSDSSLPPFPPSLDYSYSEGAMVPFGYDDAYLPHPLEYNNYENWWQVQSDSSLPPFPTIFGDCPSLPP